MPQSKVLNGAAIEYNDHKVPTLGSTREALRVFDLTANKFVYALIAESLSTLQAADTSQAFASFNAYGF